MNKTKKELKSRKLAQIRSEQWQLTSCIARNKRLEKQLQAKEEEVEERIKERIAKLKREHKPLQDEYNLLYQRWFEFGHRDKQLERKLKSYESGAEGNKMCSLQERIAELKRFLYSLKKLKQND